MVNYRRARIAGGTYFFTTTVRNRGPNLLIRHIHALRSAFREVMRQSPFALDAIVVLPDHLHTIWTLPIDDHKFSTRWRGIKSRFTRLLVREGVPLQRDSRGEYNLWQRRFWEHMVRDEADFARPVDYIHYNPAKHGLVRDPKPWRWSSVHRYIRLGFIPADWAVDPGEGVFGE
jgi:putative transposase